MDDVVKRCLDDLESRIDAVEEERLLGEWVDFSEGRFEGDVFSVKRNQPAAQKVEWPAVGVNAAIDSVDLMLLQQYGGCSRQLATAGGELLCVRANYGTAILSLPFGVEPFVMPPEMNTLPTSLPLKEADAIRRLIDGGVPDLDAGYGARVFEVGERFAEIAREYSNIGRGVHVYHPDTQGPLDICELVWGCQVFRAMYDEPDLVHALLGLVTETYIAFLRRWEKIVPFRDGGNAHWGMFHKGNIMLRDDSAMNVSPELFDEFVRPYDQRLLDEFGGGAIHFCGRGDHYIETVGQMPGLHAVAMSQPDYNDMERIYANTVDKAIALIGLKRDEANRALAFDRPLHGKVHCF